MYLYLGLCCITKYWCIKYIVLFYSLKSFSGLKQDRLVPYVRFAKQESVKTKSSPFTGEITLTRRTQGILTYSTGRIAYFDFETDECL